MDPTDRLLLGRYRVFLLVAGIPILSLLLFELFTYYGFIIQHPQHRKRNPSQIYHGILDPDSFAFIHLNKIDVNVVALLTPLQGDPDLYFVADMDYKRLMSHLPQNIRTRFSQKQSFGRLYTYSRDELISETVDAKYILDSIFSLGSYTFGLEMLQIPARDDRPAFFIVHANPSAIIQSKFSLELFKDNMSFSTYDELTRITNAGQPTYEELVQRHAVLQGPFENSELHGTDSTAAPRFLAPSTSGILKATEMLMNIISSLMDISVEFIL